MHRVKIYKITNTINTKVYIGYTERTLYERFASHTRHARQKPHYPLYAAMHEYGISRFRIELIEELSQSTFDNSRIADQRERYWIDQYNSAYPNGYNADSGSMKRLRGVHKFQMVEEKVCVPLD